MKNIFNSNFQLTDLLESDAEFIPLLSPEDEEQMNAEELPEELAILPLRNAVLFPGVVIPITVGRDKSIRLVKEAYRKERIIGVVSQKDPSVEDPSFNDLNTVGTVARILKTLQMPDGNTTVIIQGMKRFRLLEMVQETPYFRARTGAFDAEIELPKDRQFQALMQSLKDLSLQIIQKSPHIPTEASFAIKNIESPVFLINFVSSNLNIDVVEKQKLLEIKNMVQRANVVLAALTKELQLLDLKNQIQNKVKTDLDKQQRDYFLNQQLKTIQEELGGSPNDLDIRDLRAKAENKKWSKQVKDVFERELTKLQRMNPQAAEYGIQHNYLEFLVELPWNEFTEDNLDLKNAQKVLDNDHFGLDKVKERIIEYLAILKIKKDMKSPILCLVGPPGVGKTSLGKSIASALNRKYIRMSLGGLRDEAELRGHRKTYIGAMPGRIIQNLRKVKSSNPVFVLDEIDKVSGNTISGDPQSALLEVLDPEQNTNFYDNFLEMEYDLSRVMFIATANTLSSVHPALRDRMEVIDLNGYLIEEKLEIARRHLIPKQMKEHGLNVKQIIFPKKVIEDIIEHYTREAGVRTLERQLSRIIRNKARFIAMEEDYEPKVSKEDVEKVLGIRRFQREKAMQHDVPGVATGLAWTPVGGEILFIEVSLSRGKGDLKLTGNLGDVMKESAIIAYEFLKAHASNFALEPDIFDKWNVHIHVPEGATPKDGPSAGITMLTALTSAFTQRKVKSRLAMTGEITLRGKVLPVGGIKEKILAAKRSSINDIILSEDNRKDFNEIPEDYIKGINFHFVSQMTEVLELALLKEKIKNPLAL
ncbi:MAG: ATP-dependent Lon protease [Bacteroidales bacterium]|jgi:ATP-dependent Lon protease|nr:ATP-dependent Lon protease [Bacteroidales bacterium]